MTVIRNFCTPCDDAAFYNQITIAGDAPVISASAVPSGGEHPSLAPQVVIQEYDDIHRMFVSNDGATWSHIDIDYNAAQSVANISELPSPNEGTHESYHVRTNRMVYDKVVSSVYTADFNVLNNYIDFGSPLLHESKDFDISFDVRIDVAGQQEIIFGQYSTGTTGRFAFQQMPDNRFLFFIDSDAGDVVIYSTTTVSALNWYNLRLVRTGDKFDLYVDGVLEGTQIQEQVFVEQTTNTTLGTTYTSINDFNGKIRNVSIVSNNVTTKYLTETIDLPGATLSGATSALERFERLVPTRLSYCDTDTEWFNMSEMVDGQILHHRGRSAAYIYDASGDSWSLYGGASLNSSKSVPEVSVERTALYLDDRVSKKHTANYDGKVWLVDQSRTGTPRKMRPKYGLSLNGTTEYGTLTAARLPLLGNTYTLSTWVNFTGAEIGGAVFGHAAHTLGGGYCVIFRNTLMGFIAKRGGLTTDAFYGETDAFADLADTGWHHMACIFGVSSDGMDLSITTYLDGMEFPVSLVTDVGTYSDNATAPYYVGAREGTSVYYGGKLDDIRIFDSALSPSDISLLAGMKPGSLRGVDVGVKPLIWYDFEDDTDKRLVRNKGTLGSPANVILNTTSARDVLGYYSFANELGFNETTPRFYFGGPTPWHLGYVSTYEFTGSFRVDMTWLDVSNGEDHIGFTDQSIAGVYTTSTYNHARQIGCRITDGSILCYINLVQVTSSSTNHGDIFTVERDSNDIVHFRKNGEDLYTSTPQPGTFRYVYTNYGTRYSYPTTVSANGVHLSNEEIGMVPFGNGKSIATGELADSTQIIPADPFRPLTHDIDGNAGLQYTGQCPHSAIISTPVPDFDGIDDSYNFGALDLEIQDEITCSCWVKNNEAGTVGLFGAWQGSSDDRSFLFYLEGGDFAFAVSSDGTYTVSTVVAGDANDAFDAVNNNLWHHVLATFKTNDGFPKLYVNGRLASYTQSGSTGTSLPSVFPTSNAIFEIGRYNQDNANTYDGQMADVRVYNKVLSQDEISALSKGVDIRNDSLKLHVPMTGNSGNYVFDTVKGYVGTGSPINRAGSIDSYDTLVTDGYSLSTWYDGTSDWYSRSSLVGGGTKLCISAWVLPDSLSTNPKAICGEFGYSANQRSFLVELNTSNGDLRLILSSNGSAGPTYTSTGTSVSVGELAHVAIVFDGVAQTIDWYKNGIKTDQTTGTVSDYFSGVANFEIGNQGEGTGKLFSGNISKLLVHKNPTAKWSESTLWSIYNAGKTEEITNILSDLGGIAWYFPDGNSNEVLQNASGFTTNGAPEQRILTAGTLPITYGPGVLAPTQSINVYNGQNNSPYATRLNATLTDGTYTQGDNKEDSILYVRTKDTGDDRMSIFDEALSGNDDASIREDTR